MVSTSTAVIATPARATRRIEFITFPLFKKSVQRFSVWPQGQCLTRLLINRVSVVLRISAIVQACAGGQLSKLLCYDPGFCQRLGIFDSHLRFDGRVIDFSHARCRMGFVAEDQPGSIQYAVPIA